MDVDLRSDFWYDCVCIWFMRCVGVLSRMSGKETIEIITAEEVAVVVFNAESISGVSDIDGISKQLKAYIAKNDPKKMVVDFHGVKFFSSQVLGLLLDVWRKLHSYNGRIVISGINPQLHRVFRITNLDKIFEFYPDRRSAIEAIKTD